VTLLWPNSGQQVLAKMTAPASRSRATEGLSGCQICSSDRARDPKRVGIPVVAILSLIDTGTPSSRLFGAPLRQRASDARADESADSASRKQKALSVPADPSARPRMHFVTSTGDAAPLR